MEARLPICRSAISGGPLPFSNDAAAFVDEIMFGRSQIPPPCGMPLRFHEHGHSKVDVINVFVAKRLAFCLAIVDKTSDTSLMHFLHRPVGDTDAVAVTPGNAARFYGPVHGRAGRVCQLFKETRSDRLQKFPFRASGNPLQCSDKLYGNFSLHL